MLGLIDVMKETKVVSFRNLYFIYKHYNYLDNNLSNLIRKQEGNKFCIDKSRWLIKSYKTYVCNRKLPDMTIEPNCYWKPKFGSGE